MLLMRLLLLLADAAESTQTNNSCQEKPQEIMAARAGITNVLIWLWPSVPAEITWTGAELQRTAEFPLLGLWI
jgi:hypothetical protein